MDNSGLKKVSRNTADIRIVASDEEERFRQDNYLDIVENVGRAVKNEVIQCTVCSENVPLLQAASHVALRVLMCVSCNKKYDKRFSENNASENCQWCSEPVTNYSCSYCNCIFCEVRYIFHITCICIKITYNIRLMHLCNS